MTNPNDITLDSMLTGSCRSNMDAATNREAVQFWLEDLRCVGATILARSSNAVEFWISLRQAFELARDFDWTWEPVPSFPEAYLASCLNDVEDVDVKDYEHPLAKRVAQLWEGFDK